MRNEFVDFIKSQRSKNSENEGTLSKETHNRIKDRIEMSPTEPVYNFKQTRVITQVTKDMRFTNSSYLRRQFIRITDCGKMMSHYKDRELSKNFKHITEMSEVPKNAVTRDNMQAFFDSLMAQFNNRNE